MKLIKFYSPWNHQKTIEFFTTSGEIKLTKSLKFIKAGEIWSQIELYLSNELNHLQCKLLWKNNFNRSKQFYEGSLDIFFDVNYEAHYVQNIMLIMLFHLVYMFTVKF